MYVCIYIYICIMCIYIYIYIYTRQMGPDPGALSSRRPFGDRTSHDPGTRDPPFESLRLEVHEN